MRELLSGKDLRQLSLLELLAEKHRVTLAMAQAGTRYPARTLSADIQQINQYIAPAAIFSDIQGITLHMPDDCSIRYVYARLLAQSREYQMLLYFLQQEGNNREEIARELFLSVSTFQRIRREMNHKMEARGIWLAANPYCLMGEEEEISHLYIALISELEAGGMKIIPDGAYSLLKGLLEKVRVHYGLQLHHTDMEKICVWTYVRCMRIRQGHHVPVIQAHLKRISKDWLEDIHLKESFYTQFGFPLSEEVLYEMYRLFIRPEYARTLSEVPSILKSRPDLMAYSQQMERLIERIGLQLDISTADTGNLYLDLFNYGQFARRTPFILYNRSLYFFRGFSAANPGIARRLWDIVEEIYGSQSARQMRYEALYFLITHWPGIMDRVKESLPGLKIGVYMDTDVEHARFISEILQRYSKAGRVEVLTAPRADQEEEEAVDLLVTNIPLLRWGTAKVVCIKVFPDGEDWHKIQAAEEQIYEGKLAENMEQAVAAYGLNA